MKVKLTKKQGMVLDFIKNFIELNGFSPSYRDIMRGMGLSSVSAVAEHVDNLVRLGVLRKGVGEARSLEVVDLQYPEAVELFKRGLAVCDGEEAVTLRRAAEILGLQLDD